MLRSVVQKRFTFTKPVGELAKLSFFSNPPHRKFSSSSSKEGWDSFTQEEKLSCAVTVVSPSNAEMAYYKGIGLKSYGPAYADEAIAALEEAAKLDKNYLPFVEHELASIYDSLGQEEKASSIQLVR